MSATLNDIIRRQYEPVGTQKGISGPDFVLYACRHCGSSVSERGMYEHMKEFHKFENLDIYFRTIDLAGEK